MNVHLYRKVSGGYSIRIKTELNEPIIIESQLVRKKIVEKYSPYKHNQILDDRCSNRKEMSLRLELIIQ